MPFCRLSSSLALVCVVALGACGSDDAASSDATENIELSVVTRSLGPLPVVGVEYTVNCLGDEDADAPEDVRVDGQLELANSRAIKIGLLDTQSATWTGFMDLPPGPCLAQVRGRDTDGEVICTTEVPFSVVADTAIQVVVPLECPSAGFPSIDQTNLCPDLYALSCDELDSLDASASCKVRVADHDGTCGQGCDPQTCVASPNGLSCAPGPDPGVSTTVTCSEDALDCEGDGTLDSSCVLETDENFFVQCMPVGGEDLSGATFSCTALATDGDVDCDQVKVVEVECPGVTP